MKNVEVLINQLNIQSNVINFDSASLGYIPNCLVENLNQYLLNRNKNGAQYSIYWEEVEKARKLTAEKIGAEEDEIVFIQSTSMGINLVANAIALREGDEVLITDMEFPSNVYPWLNLKKQGIKVKYVYNQNGVITAEDVIASITADTKAVSISWVVSSNGLVIDINKVGDYCHRNNIIFIVDGIQGIGVLPVDVRKVKCDFFISGYFKWLMGPDGIAFTYIRKEMLSQLGFPWLGWAGMKDKFNYNNFAIDPIDAAKRYETGNMNYSAIQALVPLLELIQGYEDAIYERVKELVSYLRKSLEKIDDVHILSRGDTLSGITLITTKDDEKLARILRNHNFVFTVRNGIRISLHFYNTYEQIDKFIFLIQEAFL